MKDANERATWFVICTTAEGAKPAQVIHGCREAAETVARQAVEGANVLRADLCKRVARIERQS